ELSQDSFSSQSNASASNQAMASSKSSQEDSMQTRPSSLPVSLLLRVLWLCDSRFHRCPAAL
ncbi:unnamed protein product, partial [Tetraodon nigroviridis]